MAEVSEVNAIEIADIASINGVDAGDIETLDGVDFVTGFRNKYSFAVGNVVVGAADHTCSPLICLVLIPDSYHFSKRR